ncbi:MAG: 50S ribosomal protein L24 [Candidatus Berkiella sp.]
MLKIRRDDQIIVIAGRDKGKQGKVLKVLADSTLIVSGVNVVKKHTRPNPQLGVSGGILEKEAPISVSNVAIYNSETQRADRVGFRINPDGSKVRFFKSNSKPIDL